MAFPAFTITCAFAGSAVSREKSQPIISKLVWQEAPSTGVASTNVAPPTSDLYGSPIFRARATADSWLSVGKTPDAAGSVRIPVPANTDVDLFVEPGHKFMWQAA